MPTVFYTHPWMLSGLAALAVPVIIHLLLRRKKKRLAFSTLQFFVKQDQQSSQRRKLRNWLLLAMRLLLVALLVTAFARPFLPQGGASPASRERRQAIFVVDRSASMRAVGTDGQRWTRARDLMQKVLSSLEPEDRAALISCATHPEVLSGFAAPASLARMLADLQPAYGTSSVGEGLQQAAKLAAAGAPNALTTVYVVSDLQRSACQDLAQYPIPEDINVQVLCAADRYAPNLSISDFEPESRDAARPFAVVSSFSDEDSAEVTLELAFDDRVTSSSQFALKAGAATNISVALPALKPGWHSAKASLQGKDSLDIDNTRYAAFFVPEPLHAVLVETRKASRLFEQESFFLASALDPAQGSSNSVPSEFAVTQITPEDLVGTLSGSAARAPCDVLILPALKDIPREAGRAVLDFVRTGGGLLVFLGDGISANRYNNEFRGVLPAQLGTVEMAPDAAVGWRMGEFKTNSEAFALFGRPESGDLAIPQFLKRYSLTPGEHAAPVAFFEDGAPLVLLAAVGQGQVGLVNSSADTTWNDWPKHKTFVPWLHGLGKQLSRKVPRAPTAERTPLISGDDMEIDLVSAAPKAGYILRCPGGQKLSLLADERSRLRTTGFFVPGIYSVQDGRGWEIQRLAVNLPPRESDLASLPPLEFQQQLLRVQQPRSTSPGALLFGSRIGQKEFWRLLLLGALGLLLMETLVSNRTSA